MNKKMMASLTAAIVLSLMVAVVVFAGATRDRGTLETTPPAGKVNWTAWLRITYEDDEGNFITIHPPEEIMTEDSFNAAQGPDNGYTDAGWQIQVENFLEASHNRRVLISFCGLQEYAGKNWYKTFLWDGYYESTTEHGEVSLRTTTNYKAPHLLPVEFNDDEGAYIIKFYGTSETKYYVYRSQNRATSGSDRSNGRYMLVNPVTTNEYGYGEYHDDAYNPEYPAWYVIMYFDDIWNGPHGCHSEPPDPTGTRVIDFKTEFDLAEKVIRLSWEKVANDVLGFNLYRSTSEDIKGEIINNGMIPMDQETFVDDDLELGEIYYYTLEIVSERMSREDIKPMPISQRAGYFFFMPLIQEGD